MGVLFTKRGAVTVAICAVVDLILHVCFFVKTLFMPAISLRSYPDCGVCVIKLSSGPLLGPPCAKLFLSIISHYQQVSFLLGIDVCPHETAKIVTFMFLLTGRVSI